MQCLWDTRNLTLDWEANWLADKSSAAWLRPHVHARTSKRLSDAHEGVTQEIFELVPTVPLSDPGHPEGLDWAPVAAPRIQPTSTGSSLFPRRFGMADEEREIGSTYSLSGVYQLSEQAFSLIT